MFAQITLIPDPIFEGFLVNSGIDTDGVVNGQVLTVDIEDETELFFDGIGIVDLTGIEDFISLEILTVWNENISSLNLTQNINLRAISLQLNMLSSLDLSQNSLLESLILDQAFSLAQIDVTNNTMLKSFKLEDNNSIQNIILSSNENLESVRIGLCMGLEYVNLKNGNNTTIDLVILNDISNPNLQCFQVDDPAAVIAGVDPPYDGWFVDGDFLITDDCNLSITDNLRNQITLYPNPVKDILFLESTNSIGIENVKLYAITGASIIQSTQPRSVDLSGVPSGLYLLEIHTSRGVIIEKIIKE